MNLYTENLSELEDITAATLEERTTGEGVLRLEFAGWGPEWLRYMEPVTLYHKGELLFHGKVVSFSRSNEGGAVTASAEIQNFFWLLDRQSLGQQLTALQEAVADTNESAADTAAASEEELRELYPVQNSALMGRLACGQVGKNAAQKIDGGGWQVTWGDAVTAMRMRAPGWRVLPGSGTYTARAVAATDDEDIYVECTPGVRYRQMWATTDKMVTTASALWRMRRKARDVQYLVDYEHGMVTVAGLAELPELPLDTSDGVLLSAADMSPQYAERVTGVAVVWTNDAGQTELHTYPKELDMAADGVKVFSLHGSYYVESWDKVAQEYYAAANVLQLGGSLRLLADKLPVSPLGRRLRLTGPGTHADWSADEVYAVATHCSWDLLEHIVTVQLGREYADPEFAEAAAVEDGGDYVEEYERNMSGDADGHWPYLPNEGSEGDAGGGGGSPESPEPRYEVEQVTLRGPDGCDLGVNGWTEVWRGYVWSGNTDVYVSRRLMMRFKEESDKVYLQTCLQDSVNGTWEVAT